MRSLITTAWWVILEIEGTSSLYRKIAANVMVVHGKSEFTKKWIMFITIWFKHNTKTSAGFLVNDQCDTLFCTMYLFLFLFLTLYKFWGHRAHHQERQNCVKTTSGSCHSVLVAVSCAGWKFTSDLHTTRPPTQSYSYQRLCWHNLSLLMMSISCSSSGETKVNFQPAHDTSTNTEWQLPEVVLTQFLSLDDEHDVLITCRELKIKINT
jgi:hypothetical protein